MVNSIFAKSLVLGLGCLFILGGEIFARNPDSLRRVAYSEAAYADRVNALSGLVTHFRRTAFDSAYHYAKEQVALSEEWGNQQFVGIAYLNLGKTLLMSNRYQEAIPPYQKATELLAKANDLSNQADVSIELGYIYLVLSDYPQALYLLRQGIQLGKQVGKPAQVATGLFHLAQYFLMEPQLDSAKYYIGQSLSICRTHSILNQEANCHYTLGIIYSYENKIEEAMASLIQAHTLFDTLGYVADQAECNLNIAALFSAVGNHQEALKHERLAFEQAQGAKAYELLVKSQIGMSSTYLNMRQPQMALEAAQKGLSLTQVELIPELRCQQWLYLGIAYLELAQREKGLATLDSAKQLAQDIKAPDRLVEIELALSEDLVRQGKYQDAWQQLEAVGHLPLLAEHQNLAYQLKDAQAKILVRLGRWEEAERMIVKLQADDATAQLAEFAADSWLMSSLIEAHNGNAKEAGTALDRHLALRDSFFQGQAIQGANLLGVQFGVERKNDTLKMMAQEALIQQQRQAQETASRQRWQAIAGGTGVGLLSLGLLAFTFYRARQRAQRDAAYIQELNKEVHHRVKGHLQMLSDLIKLQAAKQEAPEAKAVLSSTRGRVAAISALHRLLYQDGEVATVNSTDFVYPIIEQLRETSGYDDEQVHIEADISPLKMDVARAVPIAIILNEWLTNSLKYAVPQTERAQIMIRLSRIGDERLVLTYEDNGPGFDPRQRRKGSYGTDLVEAMVLQLDGQLEQHTERGAQFILQFRNPRLS